MKVPLGVMERTFNMSVKALKTAPEDNAAVLLGRRLARLIDLEVGEDNETHKVCKLSVEYRAILRELGMTPGARAGNSINKQPAESEKPKSKLQQQRDELAARRAKRNAS